MSARSWAARVHLVIAWLFVACVVIQTFLIGLVLFNDGDIALHRGFGFVTFLVAILVPVSAGLARLPARQVQWSAALLGATFIQLFLGGLRWSGPSVLGALHPVGALVLFGLGVLVARRAWMLVKHPAVEDRTVVAPDAAPSPSSASTK
jgi:uncharacterized protein DUF6220